MIWFAAVEEICAGCCVYGADIAAGRMALTNYLMQSLVFDLLFYGYGFGLFGRLDPTAVALIGVAFYAGQLSISKRWLNQYRFGPFERLWPSLTAGSRCLGSIAYQRWRA